MRSLDQIALLYGTDKSSRGHSYCQYYEIFFDAIRFKEINLLEIGIDKGDSVRMWREYFSHGEIHGIDIRGGYEYLNQEGIKTHIVDQSQVGALEMFGETFDQYFDVIICDGSHNGDDDTITFNVLFKYLKAGGLFAIEDCLCSYDKTRWGKNASIYDSVRMMIVEVSMNGKMSNDSICSNKVQEAPKYKLNYYEANIEWVFA